ANTGAMTKAGCASSTSCKVEAGVSRRQGGKQMCSGTLVRRIGVGGKCLVPALGLMFLCQHAALAIFPTPTPRLVADANCDGVSSAADFTAAVIVADDGSRFPDCDGANQFRDRILIPRDFFAILHDIFATFVPPWTPTPTAVPPTPTRTPT